VHDTRILCADELQQLSWDLDLNGWAALDTSGRMQLLVGSQLPVRQLRGLLARLLAHEQPQMRSVLLCDLMAQQAQSRLAWCAELLTQEAQHCQVPLRSLITLTLSFACAWPKNGGA
jgi:hypothetical protein